MLKWWRKKTTVQSKYSDFHKVQEDRKNYYRIIHVNDNEQPGKNSNRVQTTHYGLWSFLPLFFYEQLKHFCHRYFLFISILQQIPDASPIGKYTTILPLSVVFCFSAIIAIVKDIIKHRADYKVNHKDVEVLRNGAFFKEKWREIGVGDILRVNNYDIIPADIILLSSSEHHGTCHVETTVLDGESNLKVKLCIQETMYCKDSQDFSYFNGNIECELPNKSVCNFIGRLKISNINPIPLDNKQFLPRGSILRNAKWIYGVVVYSGHETKIMLNQSEVLSKESKMDKIINSQITIIFILILVLSLLCSICCTWWTKIHFKNHWYFESKSVDAYTFCIQTISFFILYHNVIPVTLPVYIKIIRMIQAWFINNDIDMCNEGSNSPAVVRSPNLNVELGKVKHIFCDKTGTLTTANMKLKHCSIGGELYFDGHLSKLGEISNLTRDESENIFNHSRKKYISEFMRIMSVCHTVIPEKFKHTEEIVYNASSADEHALVIGSQQFGYKFHTRCPKSVVINNFGKEECYEILNLIEFTNSRKMMSIIIRTPDSKIKLYCKGADVAIFKRLSKSGGKYKNKTMIHLNNFARAGYRTLCFAYVNISEAFYKSWSDEYLKASSVLTNRDAAKNKVAKKIERELKLIGVSAIENKLQDHVPNTIQALMNARIKIWILTGDKQEAAINVGMSTKLITQSSKIITLNQTKPTELGNAIHKNMHGMDLTDEKNNYTLIITGSSLYYALSSNHIKMDFLKLCLNCTAVICCRISSTQKSEVVELVTKFTNEVTLAIGDEAYDVPMLNQASIGVGILGLEGLQASNSADYSITQFKQLPKLLFVHGAWNYEKISKMIYFFYYKNICFYALQLWFAMYSGWSSQSLFDRWSICTYNVLFTATPPLVIGLFLTTWSTETRLEFPQLYTQTKDVFNNKIFTKWIVIAVFHSITIFWISLFIMKNEVIWINGKVGEYSVFGNIIYSCMLAVVCLKAGLHVRSWSFIVHLTTWVSILSWMLFIVVYNRLEKMLLVFSISMNLNEDMFKSSIFWFTLTFTTCVVLLLDIAAIIVERTTWNKGTYTN